MASRSWPSAVSLVLTELSTGIQSALGSDLVGLYVYGSLVTGDFDEKLSDVDLVAVTTRTLTDEQFQRLDAVHRGIVDRHPEWRERVEVAYLGRDALATFRTERSPIAVISPGEAFHFKDAGYDWLINWYIVRTHGAVLVGPRASEVIDEITRAELVAAVAAQMEEWREWVYSASHQGFQAYAILTACRALYTYEHRIVTSKLQSAAWAKQRLPQWRSLIDRAVVLRSLGGHRGEADQAETAHFVNAVADEISRLHESVRRN